VIASSAVVNVTVATEGSKLIVSPSWASASACRSEPGPLSFVLVTVIVVAGRFPLAVVRCPSANGITQKPQVKAGKTRLEEDPL
jgi:hypothetical protein